MTSHKKQNLNDFFTLLCENYHEKIFKYIYFSTCNEAVSKDLTQDTFVIIYHKIAKLVNHPNPGGFIFQTAKYVLSNYKRQVYKQTTYEKSLSESYLDASPDAATSLAYHIDSKIDEAIYIEEALSCLTKEKYQLYVLHYIDGLSYKQIAQKLNINEVALRMKYVRLRREVQNNIHHIALTHFDELGGI